MEVYRSPDRSGALLKRVDDEGSLANLFQNFCLSLALPSKVPPSTPKTLPSLGACLREAPPCGTKAREGNLPRQQKSGIWPWMNAQLAGMSPRLGVSQVHGLCSWGSAVVSVGGGRGIKGIHILETPPSKQIASVDVEDGKIPR